MPTIQDIRDERDSAAAKIDAEILRSDQLRDGNNDQTIDQRVELLLTKKLEITSTALATILSTPQIQSAIDELQAVNSEMTKVAGRMVTAKKWLDNVAQFLALAEEFRKKLPKA